MYSQQKGSGITPSQDNHKQVRDRCEMRPDGVSLSATDFSRHYDLAGCTVVQPKTVFSAGWMRAALRCCGDALH